jgi:outer membrane protein assembly factor BamB
MKIRNPKSEIRRLRIDILALNGEYPFLISSFGFRIFAFTLMKYPHILLPLLLLTLPLRGEDWPEFRGPTAQGHSSAALPVKWSATENMVWRSELPGVGWSSPVVIGDRIYLTTAVPVGGEEKPDADRSLRALAVEGASGKVLWSTEVFLQKAASAPKIHRKNSHASPTAVHEDGLLYVHFGHQGTACLNASDGKVLWSTREFAYQPVHGNGSSPVIAGDLLIFSADAAADPAVIALDKKSGKLRWKFERKSDAKRKFSFCTPLLIEVGGKKQLITPGSGVVNALDPATGREIWHAKYGEGYSVVPRPVFAHGMIFIGTGYDKPVVMAIRVDGTGDVTNTHVAWQSTKFAPHNPSMIIIGNLLYMVADNGVLSCMDAKNGEVYFQERATGPISASPLHANGHLYLLDEQGLGLVVKTGGKTLDIIARNELKERALASPAVIGGDLLIRTEKALYRIARPTTAASE